MMRRRVVAVLFDGFELLDLAGPLEFLGMCGRVTNKKQQYVIETTAKDLVPKLASDGETMAGVKWVVDYSFKQLIDAKNPIDVLLVPGGMGVRKLVNDNEFLMNLKDLVGISHEIASVCTGSALLGKCGVLNGRKATTNKLSYLYVTQELKYPGSTIQWMPKARWVKDGNIWTSSGVAAGADMGLALISQHYGHAVAKAIAKRAEYIWNENADDDPFEFLATGGKL